MHLDGFPAAQDENGELRRHWRQRNPELDLRRSAYRDALPFVNPESFAAEGEGANPDAMLLTIESGKRPGVARARNDLWADYGSNVERYPQWQRLLARLQPPTLVIWGTRDEFFTTPGALAYRRELPRAEMALLDSTHFATLHQPQRIAERIDAFLRRLGPSKR